MEDNDVLPELQAYGPSLTTAEAAAVLRLDRAQVGQLLKRGELPGFRVGGRWRLRRSDVQLVMLGKWEGPDVPDQDDD
ncbi:helix-turn-helix domain-containing protein (plasmid) [Janibacter melonis]|uniref:Helix-turn-helix domain-containing protein n=1 Tax=Janibacter melonis TaxID=262209 RepID=A0A650GFI7_9MICO|nr:helix-turn-helix domain-containing protein [Janibacter melonis]MCB5993194.1 helix-turn-helix domain-containing protein [Janibacter melonis]QGX08809.1 helix-turn-helix domain-containing protein [Janibacter melonis]